MVLLENALSEEVEPAQAPQGSQQFARRDYTAEQDKTIAACTGAVLTSLTMTPFDVIKTRLQTQPTQEPLFVPSSRLPPPSHHLSTAPWPPPIPSTSTAPPSSSTTCCQKTYFSANTSDKNLRCKFDPRIARSALPAAVASHITPGSSFPQHLHHLAPTQFAVSNSAAGAAILSAPTSAANCLYPSAAQASRFLPRGSPNSTRPRHLTGFWDALFHIVRSEGATSLWRGTGPALMMSVPGQVIYMVGYDWGRRTAFSNPPSWATVTPRVGETDRRLSPTYLALVPLLAGSLSRTVVAVLLSPAELLRTQLQAQTSQSRTSLLALVRTLRWSTAWKGLPPTLWRDVPFSGFYWAGYEGIKRALTGKGLGEGTGSLRGDDQQWRKWKEFGIAFVSGAGSGMIAATLTNPFDVVKTRRQALSSASQPTGTLSILADIFKREGWNGMTKGLTPRLAKVAPACGIVVGVFEFLPPALQDWRDEKKFPSDLLADVEP
ncbi:uncharacterized protein JCM15063_001241 [Sporobolomyces koalae]|uniref:uncharacterized protein n=1 Tax=Sporobolomyces koalae TaxID=500713 RepID=UPI00317B99A2